MMDDINAEMDLQFESMVDDFDREPEIDERREMRESLQPWTYKKWNPTNRNW